MPPESADELLERAARGRRGARARSSALLIERTEGNPFFLEESVRTLVETGRWSASAAPIGWPEPVPSDPGPGDGPGGPGRAHRPAAPEDKRLLQTAAVIGKDVPVRAAPGHRRACPRRPARAGSRHLQAAEFLYETRLFPDLEYTFKHALTHEVAYGSLLQDRRRALHARIVDAIERLYPDRLGEHVERLAHHAFRADLRGKAMRYLQQAGIKAVARSAHQEAVIWFGRGPIGVEK